MAKVTMVEVTRFVTDCVVAAGSPRKPAEELADLLLAADKCGHRSHGLNRLERYIHDIVTGLCNPFNTPKILKETAATAWVNANNVLGATAGNFCTDIALQKATSAGVGCVSTKGSNHFGIGGYWAQKLANKGMIGMIFTNGSPLVAPTRGTKAALGTNPLAVVGPGLPSTGPFYLDISTATVALGKLEMCRRRGIKLLPGWAQGPDGKETLDPDLAIKSGCLMPLGGTEASGGYKGFGLGGLVDMLSGILSGAHYGHHVPKWTPDTKTEANIGQTFLAINPKCFAPGFEERVSDVISFWRNMKPTDPKAPVLAPGDIEKRQIIASDKSGEIEYIDQMLDACDKLAAKLKVQQIKRTKLSSGGWSSTEYCKKYLFEFQGCLSREYVVIIHPSYLPRLAGTSDVHYETYPMCSLSHNSVPEFRLQGSNYGHNVRSWSHSGAGGPANLGHCFVAVNPECFAPCFGDRLADCITHWRQMEPTDPKLPVLAPGDKDKQAAAETDTRGYVTYVKQQIVSSTALAERLNIKPMEVEMDEC